VEAEIAPPKSKTTDREIVRSLSPEYVSGKEFPPQLLVTDAAGHVRIKYLY
jgi:hypothetical protein